MLSLSTSYIGRLTNLGIEMIELPSASYVLSTKSNGIFSITTTCDLFEAELKGGDPVALGSNPFRYGVSYNSRSLGNVVTYYGAGIGPDGRVMVHILTQSIKQYGDRFGLTPNLMVSFSYVGSSRNDVLFDVSEYSEELGMTKHIRGIVLPDTEYDSILSRLDKETNVEVDISKYRSVLKIMNLLEKRMTILS